MRTRSSCPNSRRARPSVVAIVLATTALACDRASEPPAPSERPLVAREWTRIDADTRLACRARTHAELGGVPIEHSDPVALVAVLEARAGTLERWQLVGADEPLRVEIGPDHFAVAVGATWHTVAQHVVPPSPGAETPGVAAAGSGGGPACIEATMTEERTPPQADTDGINHIVARWSGRTEHTWQWCEGRGLVAWRRVDVLGEAGRRERSITCGFASP